MYHIFGEDIKIYQIAGLSGTKGMGVTYLTNFISALKKARFILKLEIQPQ